jgi:hypothetical protein
MQTKTFLKLLPKTVKIGPHTWNVISSDETGEDKDGSPNQGLTQFLKQTILIYSELADSTTVVGVLIHELYHAALFSLGHQHPKREEEGACFVETMMTTIFRDNPGLLDLFKKGMK